MSLHFQRPCWVKNCQKTSTLLSKSRLANADPIKYEVDKESGALFVGRFMSTRDVLSMQLRLHQPTPCLWTVTRLTCWFQRHTHCSQAQSFAAAQLAC